MRKLAIVSGATGGIGRAVCAALAREGFRLVLLGRSREKLEFLASELREERVHPTLIIHDFEKDDMDALLRDLSDKIASCGEYGYLVYILAHGYGTMEPFHIRSGDSVAADVACNYTSFVALVGNALSFGNSGVQVRVILLGSCLASVPAPFSCTYCSAKAGLDGLSTWPCGEGAEISVIRASPVRNTEFYSHPHIHGGCAVLRALRIPGMSITPERVTNRIIRILHRDIQKMEPGKTSLLLKFRRVIGTRSSFPLGPVAWICDALHVVFPAPALIWLARALTRSCQCLCLLPRFQTG